MRWRRHQVDGAVTQRFEGSVVGKDQLGPRFKTLRAKEAEFDRCNGGKIGIGDKVGDRDDNLLHVDPYSPFARIAFQLRTITSIGVGFRPAAGLCSCGQLDSTASTGIAASSST